ncbi:MAG: hypothetical protein H6Q68_2679 [Firmicutes bacterium]|nr:hypothetical protein [Bacillota bacterium]
MQVAILNMRNVISAVKKRNALYNINMAKNKQSVHIVYQLHIAINHSWLVLNLSCNYLESENIILFDSVKKEAGHQTSFFFITFYAHDLCHYYT